MSHLFFPIVYSCARPSLPRRYIDVRAAMGFTAIHMAASQGHWQAVMVLLQYGASLGVRCHGVLRADFSVPARWRPNSTPLHIAAARGSTSMVKHMLQAFVSSLPPPPSSFPLSLQTPVLRACLPARCLRYRPLPLRRVPAPITLFHPEGFPLPKLPV